MSESRISNGIARGICAISKLETFGKLIAWLAVLWTFHRILS